MKLTKDALIREAEIFCKLENSKNHPELIGINDGKSIGTYIEHEFKKFLENKYEFNSGSSAQGIDFPDKNINTDLKVTSNKKPQNSCPFNDIKQKIYGLGYNLLLFIYSKND
ncbi:MAG: restriction endonuclease, partial [Methanosphaera sp. rholeuAM6]